MTIRLVFRAMSKQKTLKKRRPAKQPAARWQLQTAKARFSEVFRRARSEGPQWITRQGREAVPMLPAEEFERALRGVQSSLEALPSSLPNRL